MTKQDLDDLMQQAREPGYVAVSRKAWALARTGNVVLAIAVLALAGSLYSVITTRSTRTIVREVQRQQAGTAGRGKAITRPSRHQVQPKRQTVKPSPKNGIKPKTPAKKRKPKRSPVTPGASAPAVTATVPSKAEEKAEKKIAKAEAKLDVTTPALGPVTVPTLTVCTKHLSLNCP